MIITIHTIRKLNKDRIATVSKKFLAHPKEAIIDEPAEYIKYCYNQMLIGDIDEIHINSESETSDSKPQWAYKTEKWPKKIEAEWVPDDSRIGKPSSAREPQQS